MNKTLVAGLCALLLSLPATATPDLEALLHSMTVEEKLGQVQQLDGFAEGPERPEHADMIRKGLLGSTLNVRGAARTNLLQRIAMTESRLKIPVLFAFDVIHGYRTIFPVPLGEAASWDVAMVRQAAHVAAEESYATGVRWVFAPMVDIARDPRWGRVVEGSGEDPYLGSAMARARVEGFQGKDYKVVACAKHWVGYGLAEGGRDYNTVDMSERQLREVYLPPFKAAVDAGVGTFMSAFNDLSGVPSTANPFTLTEVLRGEWKFDGFVVSDYTAIEELIQHGVAKDGREAFKKALEAGVDMEMVSTNCLKFGPELIRSGVLKQKTLDEAVRRILRIKARLGLFDHPYTDESLEASSIFTAANRQAARVAAARSLVLLKNTGVLPLSSSIRSVAVVGPLADSQVDIMGSWNGDGHASDCVTLLAGIRNRLPGAQVTCVKGCDVLGKEPPHIEEAVTAALGAEVVIVAIGESADLTGEATSRSSLEIPGHQRELVEAIRKTGKPFVVVLMNGRPLVLDWLEAEAPALLETWFAGSEGGNGIADVLFGKVNPGGKLPISFPRNVGQLPVYYSHRNTGRPIDPKNPGNRYTSHYSDVSNEPLYPFGYGLSYTTFEFSGLRVTPSGSGNFKVSVELANTGKLAGDEVAQLYIRGGVSSVARPIRQLKGFQRVTLGAGDKRSLEFTLGPQELGCLDQKLHFSVEPGVYEVWVGSSSQASLRTEFSVK